MVGLTAVSSNGQKVNGSCAKANEDVDETILIEINEQTGSLGLISVCTTSEWALIYRKITLSLLSLSLSDNNIGRGVVVLFSCGGRTNENYQSTSSYIYTCVCDLSTWNPVCKYPVNVNEKV